MLLPRLALALLQAPGAPGSGTGDGGAGEALAAGPAFPWIPVILLAGPALVAVVLVWLYLRTARRLRQAQLAPPVWLLPYLEKAGAEGPPPAWPPAAPDPDDVAEHEARVESLAQLGRRKRALLVGLALNFVAGWAAAGVYLYESKRSVDYQELPSTATLGSSVDTARFQGLEEGVPGPAPAPQPALPPERAPLEPLDTAAARIRQEQRLAFFRRRDSLAELRRLDSVAIAEAEARRVRDSVARAIQDSIARAAASLAPPPAPAPTPAPPPAPVPPPPDPRVELERATGVIRAGAAALVAAINARSGVADLLAPGARRDRLVEFVSESSPAASLVSVTGPTLADAAAEAMVTVQFQWRGPFGDTRRRTGRFRADAARAGAAWRLVTLTPLDNLP